MICRKCKKEIQDDALFCPYCGISVVPKRAKPRTRGNGTGTAYKLPNGTYRAVVTIGYRMDGKRITRSKQGFKTKREALEAIPSLKNELIVNSKITLDELHKMWSAVGYVGKSESTVRVYKKSYSNHICQIRNIRLCDIRLANIQSCISKIPGKATQEAVKSVLSQMFDYAIKNDIMEKNYAKLVTISGAVTEDREPFTKDELEVMWNNANVPGVDQILILCYTGFRLNEFLSLKNTDLHRENIGGEDFWYFTGGSKTKAGKDRMVPISPKILPLVMRYRKIGYLFTQNGKKVSDVTFRKRIYSEALKQIGVPYKVPHCCRHTYATLMKNVNCVSEKDKMASIGHTSMDITNHYTHADKVSLKLLAEML